MPSIIRYHKRLLQIAAEKKLWLRVLGHVDQFPIWYVRNHAEFRHGPRLLIAGGFHGEEIGGPLGIQAWLEDFEPNLYNKFNLSFIPIVNPHGFNYNQRKNKQHRKTNCGFCHPESGDQLSEEGIILLKNFSLLKASAKDGFLSLHEDVTTTKTYLYAFEHTEAPSDFTLQMRGVLTQFFPEILDNEYVVTDARGKERPLALDGIVWKLCDGSFEDFLFHEGSKCCFVTETPGRFPLGRRIEASKKIISRFIEIAGGS